MQPCQLCAPWYVQILQCCSPTVPAACVVNDVPCAGRQLTAICARRLFSGHVFGMPTTRRAAAAAAAESAITESTQSAAEKTQDEISALADVVVERGKKLLAPLMERLKDPEQHDPSEEELREPYELFMIALHLDPDNEDAQTQTDNLQGAFEVLPNTPMPANHDHDLDVIVVGAGCSGVGVAHMLTQVFGLETQRVLLVDRGGSVGETFRRWPKEMRFISPSFNQQGWTKSFDLNAVAYGTSPAFFSEHPTGEQYASYLEFLAKGAGLRIDLHTEVKSVRPLPGDDGGFEVEVVKVGEAPQGGGGAPPSPPPTVLKTRYVIWAAGEFQYPRAPEKMFPGAEHCMHNATVRSWAKLPGDDFVVIGGYESGMDACFNLATCGKRSTVVSSQPFWNLVTDDPSTELAPYTVERVRKACATPTPPRLLAPLRVVAVEPLSGDEGSSGGYVVRATWGAPIESKPNEHEYRTPLQVAVAAAEAKASDYADRTEGAEVLLKTPQPPILATGFLGSIAGGVVKDLFAWGAHTGKSTDGADESGESDDEGAEGGEGGAEDEGEEECEAGGEAAGAADADADADAERDSMDEDEGDGNGGGSGCAEGAPLLNDYDESTTTPGLFLVGPAVRHGELSFCFVYKFRQRFGIVADAIARGLGRDTTESVLACQEQNMYLDDFECCEDTCGAGC